MVDDLTRRPPPGDAVPPGVEQLADYAALAPRHLPADTWAHIEERSGGEDHARAALLRRRLVPRALASLAGGSTAIRLLGQTHAVPLLIAPLAYAGIAHPEGELAVARAAAAMRTGLVVSTLASRTLEAIAAAHGEGAALVGDSAPLWFQLYWQPRQEDGLALVRRAEAAGYGAIVLTIDAAIKRSAYALPPGIAAVNLPGNAAARHTAAAGGSIVFGTALADAAPTWDDLARLREAARLPILVKGMFGAGDAVRMAAAGVDALILSDHGGRVFGRLPPPIDMLDAVCAAAAALPVLIDGGIRSGSDVAVALASGAAGVLVGRPVLHALAVAGTAGVAHVCHLLRAELEVAMAQLGCATVEDLATLEVLADGARRT